MPDKCVLWYSCGATAPGWLDGTHPTVAEGVVTRRVCYHTWDRCCYWSNNIKVKNCSSYYVYELQKPPTCNLRYCGNAGAVDGCTNYRVLSGADRAQENTLQNNLTCDSNLVTGWYRFQGAAGDRMLDKCVPQYHCGGSAPGWLYGTHPTVAEGVVTRKVCYHYRNRCCYLWNVIKVKNCGSYYVYELSKLIICDFRYCGNAGAAPTTMHPTTAVSTIMAPSTAHPTTIAATTPVAPSAMQPTTAVLTIMAPSTAHPTTIAATTPVARGHVPVPPSDDDIGTTKVAVHLSGMQVLSNGKAISFYQMIVISLKEGQNQGKSSDEKYVTITRNFDTKVKGEPYITAEFANDKSRTTFTIGDDKYYSRAGVTEANRKRRDTYRIYLNGKLDEGTRYAVFERAFAEDGDYQNLGFITFTTKKTNTPFIIAISIAVGLFALLMVIGGIVIWHRCRHNERNSSSKNPHHCSTQEIIEMSPSPNPPTSNLAYSNPCTDPGYDNTDHVRNKTETTGQATYEEIGEAVSDQAAGYDDVQSTPESIYQEIDDETLACYQSLNINRQVTYEGYVKPVTHH